MLVEKIQNFQYLGRDEGCGSTKALGARPKRTELFFELVFRSREEQIMVCIKLLHLFGLLHLVQVAERSIVNLLSYVLVEGVGRVNAWDGIRVEGKGAEASWGGFRFPTKSQALDNSALTE